MLHMTESKFWEFLEGLWKSRGREPQFHYEAIDIIGDPVMREHVRYIRSHIYLPLDYSDIPKEAIMGMGKLVFDKSIKDKTREAILTLLAHNSSKEALEALKKYNTSPDKGFKTYAKIALDECRQIQNGENNSFYVSYI